MQPFVDLSFLHLNWHPNVGRLFLKAITTLSLNRCESQRRDDFSVGVGKGAFD
jgi:hypothetical protein